MRKERIKERIEMNRIRKIFREEKDWIMEIKDGGIMLRNWM